MYNNDYNDNNNCYSWYRKVLPSTYYLLPTAYCLLPLSYYQY